MAESPSNTEILLARTAVALLLGLAVLEVVWHGLSSDDFSRLWRNVVARPGGPMTFRFVLQPVMALLAAFRDGVRDARLDRTPYLSAIVFGGGERRGARLWEGVVSTARILILGAVMDVAYQLAFLNSFYPAESALIAILLAFLPYALMRGPLARLARLARLLKMQRAPADRATFSGRDK